jgi:hypothetical protein
VTIVKTIPLVIAPHPACPCGARLCLSHHSVQQTEAEWACQITYVCAACARHKRVGVRKLTRALTTRWRHTTRITLGPTGVTYEHAPAAAPASPPVKV